MPGTHRSLWWKSKCPTIRIDQTADEEVWKEKDNTAFSTTSNMLWTVSAPYVLRLFLSLSGLTCPHRLNQKHPFHHSDMPRLIHLLIITIWRQTSSTWHKNHRRQLWITEDATKTTTLKRQTSTFELADKLCFCYYSCDGHTLLYWQTSSVLCSFASHHSASGPWINWGSYYHTMLEAILVRSCFSADWLDYSGSLLTLSTLSQRQSANNIPLRAS